jgi:hypothetical protein
MVLFIVEEQESSPEETENCPAGGGSMAVWRDRRADGFGADIPPLPAALVRRAPRGSQAEP